MSTEMSSALSANEDLYLQLYDVREEAEHQGNLIEIDPYPLLNAAREAAPVHRGFAREVLGLPRYHRHMSVVEELPGYSVYSFELAEKAFRDNQNLSNHIYQMPHLPDKGMGILEMDNPEHHSYRKAVQSLFIKPRAVGMWRDRWINDITRSLIDSLHGQGRAELNMQLCARLPVHTITRAVGLHGEAALEFRQAIIKTMGGRFGADGQVEGFMTTERMLSEQIAKRRAVAEDDIISSLVAAEIDVPGEGTRHLTDMEIRTFCRLLLLAGGGTSWRQMGIILFALLTHLDQFEAVKNDRALVEPAIEESMRWNPNNPMFSRLVAHDIELGGIAIPAGAALDIVLAAANRDPERWDNPDEFDIHRPFKQHLGFGIGAHMCLGRNVAVSEIYSCLTMLMDEFPKLRLDPDQPAPHLTGGLEQRGVSALHVLLD